MLVRFLWLAMGVLLGLAWATTWPTNPPPVSRIARTVLHVAPRTEIQATAPMPIEKPVAPLTARRQEIVIQAGGMERTVQRSADARHPVEAPVQEPQRLSLRLDEEIVSEMERESEHLREMGRAVRTADGWRIYLTPEDRIFAKTGLRSGDLISNAGLEAELQNPERARLAFRLIGVLNAIRQ